MASRQRSNSSSRRQALHSNLKLARRNIALYVFLLPAVIYLILFNYAPMYGIQIAFRNFTFADGITGSKWVGLKWFNYFFKAKNFGMILGNTIKISLYSLVAGFPFPILLALILGPMCEQNFVRFMDLNGGNFWAITGRPIAVAFFVVAVAVVLFSIYNQQKINKREAADKAAEKAGK